MTLVGKQPVSGARSIREMSFGKRVRELRISKGFTLRKLAPRVGVGFTYLSRVENEHLNYGDYPSDALIHRLAETLEADEDELLILAKRIPERIKQRVLERPEVFARIADLDDKTLNGLMSQIGQKKKTSKRE